MFWLLQEIKPPLVGPPTHILVTLDCTIPPHHAQFLYSIQRCVKIDMNSDVIRMRRGRQYDKQRSLAQWTQRTQQTNLSPALAASAILITTLSCYFTFPHHYLHPCFVLFLQHLRVQLLTYVVIYKLTCPPSYYKCVSVVVN
jgi:hypothetical protein